MSRPGHWLTLAEAADRLGLDPSTLRRQIARGSLRAIKLGPVWTVSRLEVDRYRDEHLGRRGYRRRCGVRHPTLGPCVVAGRHGGPEAPHRYAEAP